ncbi:Protein of unknown function [Micromonospora lupini str. Lupac 08]|uniref:Uncharacterized protein n=1 Tax=Micromonospora lupini str. Lupac 08 TaxID=1150864 RepID=I0L7A6_9ACTN|nr:Protein of unknown function [Micromonospora lupini str. Lupac 08]
MVGVVVHVVVATVGVMGVGSVDERLAGRLRWRLLLDGGVVTRDVSLRHASPRGYESWSHARRDA